LVFVLAAVLVWYRFLLSPQALWTDDGHLHTARGAQYYLALRDGQFPPRWAGNLANGGGSPIFIFAYPLMLLTHVGVYIVLPGIGFVLAYNLSVLWYVVIASFAIYLLARQRN